MPTKVTISPLKVILVVVIIVQTVECVTQHEYQHLRSTIKHKRSHYGSELPLTKDELEADKILLKLKYDEIKEGIRSQTFPPSKSFFETRNLIEKSKVFQIIKDMPKGAALHLHDLAMVDVSWIVHNFTYSPDCYVCLKGGDIHAFAFAKSTPGKRDDCDWLLANDIREHYYKSRDDFDDLIIHHLTIEPENKYSFDPCCVDQNKIWQRAETAFKLLSDIIFVQPNLGQFWARALEEFRLDGVLYVEPRSLIFKTTDADGRIYSEEHYLRVYKQINDVFVEKNADSFIGSKIIKCDLKFMDVGSVNESLDMVMGLRERYPDFLAGYDLVGQEDKSIPLEQYLDVLLRPSQMTPPVDLPYFFHAGETDWYDTTIDWNLLDAILLNSSRIGHGYSLVKHPDLLQLVKERDIAVEINPISNQVLGLITDLRNHPVSQLMAMNVSVVISSDDPSIWRSLPLSHDFYEVFMASTGMGDGLRVLKKLALNSIRYSSMDERQRARAYKMFDRQWNAFIKRTIKCCSQYI